MAAREIIQHVFIATACRGSVESQASSTGVDSRSFWQSISRYALPCLRTHGW